MNCAAFLSDMSTIAFLEERTSTELALPYLMYYRPASKHYSKKGLRLSGFGTGVTHQAASKHYSKKGLRLSAICVNNDDQTASKHYSKKGLRHRTRTKQRRLPSRLKALL